MSIVFIVIIIIIRWQWYYNKTQHTKIHKSRKIIRNAQAKQHTKLHKQQRTHYRKRIQQKKVKLSFTKHPYLKGHFKACILYAFRYWVI
jgi:hypothetical protein